MNMILQSNYTYSSNFFKKIEVKLLLRVTQVVIDRGGIQMQTFGF